MAQALHAVETPLGVCMDSSVGQGRAGQGRTGSHCTTDGDGSYLHCIGSCVPSCLASHELEAITPSTQHSRHQCNPSAIVVLEVGPKGRFGDAKGWFVQETDVNQHSTGKECQGEVEEGCVHDQVRHAFIQLVPLVIGCKVESRGEDGVAGSSCEDNGQSNELA